MTVLTRKPLALSQALLGIRRYGTGVKKVTGCGFADQFRRMFKDCRDYGFTPFDFYLYQLYLTRNRRRAGRHFSFTQVLPLYEYLLDIVGCEDFELLRHKHLFARRCAEAGLPTAPLVAEFADGEMIEGSSGKRTSLPREDIIAKPSRYWCGIGVNLWRWQATGTYVNAVTGEHLDEGGLIHSLCRKSRSGRLVVQRRIFNHSSMIGSMTSGGLATVRLVTCKRPSGRIVLLPPVLRMPIGNGVVDNFSQGGLAAPVDLTSGEICGAALREHRKTGVAFHTVHPDTGSTLEGLRLPFWKSAVNLALRAHLTFPNMLSVGWDIAILQRGPVVLEGNSTWDVGVTVLPHGLTLADTPFIPCYNHHMRAARKRTAHQ